MMQDRMLDLDNMAPQSPALIHKIAKLRAQARSDLPLVAHCLQVVLVWASGDGDLDLALSDLRAAHGPSWSVTSALQLLSGRRGLFAAELCEGDARVTMFLAHVLAKDICSKGGLGAAPPPTLADLEKLAKLAAVLALQGAAEH